MSPTPIIPSNVPAALSSFVGRVREVAGVGELLGATRLLTVVGPGGVGKTRLAREVAVATAARAPRGTDPAVGGVWWVELASVAPGGGAEDVLQVLGGALGVRPTTGGAGIGDAVEAALAAGRALVVLDNCEHVVDAAAHVADRLLRASPQLTILATSREALGTEGETAWQLPPLAHPALARAAEPAAAVPTAADLAGYDAVALFVDRARAASPGFALADANAPAVAAICDRLDGLPLAIELAAAALPALGAEALAERLGDALGLLTRGRRTALPRHKTLRAVLDWSYRLLDPAAQALLARLSVFRGAFTLDAAEAVDGHDLPGGVPVLAAFGRLVEQSLVDVREARDARGAGDARDGRAGGEPRYALLETVRQYAAARLRGTPDEPVARRRHAAWVARVAEAAAPGLWSPAHRRTADQLRLVLDDLRAAIAWTTAPGSAPDDVLLGVRIVGVLGFFLTSSVPWAEGRRAMRLAFEAGTRAGLGDRARPLATRLAFFAVVVFEGGMANHMGDAAAALAADDTLGPLIDAAEADLAALADTRDPRWAHELAEWTETVTWARTCQEDLRSQALFQIPGSDPVVAVAHARNSIERSRTLRNRWHATLLRGRYASLLTAVGRHADAAVEWEQTIAGFRAYHDPWMLSYALQGMAANAVALGAAADAARYAAEAAAVLRGDPDPWFTSRALDVLAAACAAVGAFPPAARLLGAAEELRRQFGLIVIALDRDHHAAARAAAEQALGADAAAAARAAGAALSPDAMIALAEDAARAVQHAARGAAAEGETGDRVAAAPTPREPSPAAAPRTLRIDVLGQFAAWRDGRALGDDTLPGGKARELLLWLVLHPRGTKEQIGLDLWPDASPAQLRAIFHITLHHLRRALGDPRWIGFAGSAYALARALDRADGGAPHEPPNVTPNATPDGALDVDADAVLAAVGALRQGVRRAGNGTPEALAGALDAGALEAARAGLARYRGPLVTVTGFGSAAGEWITAHQDRLRSAWADGTALLGVLDSAAERHADAVAALERVLAVEPLREGVHRALMQAYAASGEPARALVHYDALTRLLAREVGTAPARETQALADRLRRAGAAGAAGQPPVSRSPTAPG